jgi:hypothetical protein
MLQQVRLLVLAKRSQALLGLGLVVLAANAAVGVPGAIAGPLFQIPPEEASQAEDQLGDVVVDTESPTPGSPSPDSTQTPAPSNPTLANTRFACQSANGQYTVVYNPESQPGKVYPWANPSAMGGGWTPERRCNEISRRLEAYRPDGLLEMRTGVENGYNVICVTTQKNSSCRIVLTVPQGQDPTSTRNRVFENLTIADNGQQTQAVNTYVGNDSNDQLSQIGRALGGLSKGGRRQVDNSINLRPYLDQADGGTGEYLRSGMVRTSPGRRLNPNRFR